MAGVAKESLSPLIRNVQVRRVSIELCQKIGTQLLSPLSPGRNIQIGNLFSQNNNNNELLIKCVSSSPTTLKIKQNIRRGSSGCISSSPNTIINNVSTNFQSHILKNQRRSSLTTTTTTGTPGTKFLNVSTANYNNNTTTFTYQIPKIEINDDDDVENIDTNIYENDDNENIFTQTLDWNTGGGVEPNFKKKLQNLPKSDEELMNHFEDDKENLNPSTPTINQNIPTRTTTSLLSSTFLNHHHNLSKEYLKFVFEKSNLLLNPNEILGRGTFGTVISGIYKGEPVAVKIINTNTTSRADSLQGEKIALNELLIHPNITKVIDILQISIEQNLVLMEKLYSKNLLNIINDINIHFDLMTSLKISGQITSGLLFCHQLGILHLDTKPQNILIDVFAQQCKLSDFGNAKRICDLKNPSNYLKLQGTVIYKAPELFRGYCPTDKCDIYSMGITMWHILNREYPYRNENEHSIIYKVVAQGLRPLIICKTLPQYNLCEMCWDEEPMKRPNANDLLNHLNYLQVQVMKTQTHLNFQSRLFF